MIDSLYGFNELLAKSSLKMTQEQAWIDILIVLIISIIGILNQIKLRKLKFDPYND